MSDTDSSHYTDGITTFSENELERLLGLAAPPVCLLGGWAVHLHVTEPFEAEYGRSYIGSRDIDVGVFIDPDWTVSDIEHGPVADTMEQIESKMGYERGRFGFYRYYRRTSREPLSEDEAAGYPQHEIFRVDIDMIPSTDSLDRFEESFGFRPPAEPLLQPVFEDGHTEILGDYVDWDVPTGVFVVPRPILAAMKIRSYPDRDKGHKRIKDLADLHALLWYGSDYQQLSSAVFEYLDGSDLERFRGSLSDEQLHRASALLDVETELLANSIRSAVI
jgi:hypothetical protein